MSAKNNQLTQVENFNTKDLIFSKVQEFPIPGNEAGLVYRRVSIGRVNSDKTKGDLVIKTPKCFSFGVSPNINDGTGLVDGYSVPLCLMSRDGWAPGEKEFYDGFLEIIEAIKQHCLMDDVKEDLGKFDMVYTDLRKLNPIYRKKDKKGRVMEDAGPVLYPKALMNKKTGNMMTTFYEEDKYGEENGDPLEIDYKDLISDKVTKNYCYVTAALKIESIYVGQNLSLQIKMVEADVEKMNTKKTSLLRTSRPVVNTPQNILIEKKTDESDSESDEEDDDENLEDDDGETQQKLVVSESDSDSDIPVTKPTKSVKKVVKKVVKK